ncbi:MAG: hypothetical protein U1E70_12515 [Acetobacteraceae bacterium]
MTFTILRIDELIACDKQITDAPTRDFKDEFRHRRKDFRLQGIIDPKLLFAVFMRQSLEFAEDFSLGLVYLSEDGKRMTLIRYNGQHDQSNDPYDLAKPHFQYHIHKATPENLNNGRYTKHPAATTGLYASFTEATQEFLATIGLRAEDIAKHFPGMDSLPLFRNRGDDPR